MTGGDISGARRQRLAIIAAGLLVAAYFACVLWLAPGGPFGDDLDIVRTTDAARAAQNPWPHLLEPHNEHRLLVTRLIFWGQAALTGAYEFTLLALIGNLFLLGVFAVFVARARALGTNSGWAILFAATMTFSFTAADSALWAMAALSNYGVLAAAIATFWMLGKGGDRWAAGASVMAVLAVASQSNGLLVGFLGAGLLMAQGRRLWSIAWLVISVVLAWLYLSSGGATSSGLHTLLTQPLSVLVFAITVSGSMLGYPTGSAPLGIAMLVVSAFLGAMLWAVTIHTFVRRRLQVIDPLLWFAVFLIGSAVMVAVGRIGGDTMQPLAPRYHVLSCLLLVCCVFSLADGERSPRISAPVRRWLPALALAGVAYVGVSTLTLWRMHEFYTQYVGTRGPG